MHPGSVFSFIESVGVVFAIDCNKNVWVYKLNTGSIMLLTYRNNTWFSPIGECLIAEDFCIHKKGEHAGTYLLCCYNVAAITINE